MKVIMITKTIEVCKKVYNLDTEEYYYVVKTIKGSCLFDCLAKVTEDIECMVADKELTTIDGILGRLHYTNYNGDLWDDFIIYIKDITNKDFVFIADCCEIDTNVVTNYDKR